MINVYGARFSTKRKCYEYSSGGTKFIAPWTDSVASHPVRIKTDYLDQGGPFDSFGNKSVRHQQWTGDLFAAPTGMALRRATVVNGREVLTPSYYYGSKIIVLPGYPYAEHSASKTSEVYWTCRSIITSNGPILFGCKAQLTVGKKAVTLSLQGVQNTDSTKCPRARAYAQYLSSAIHFEWGAGAKPDLSANPRLELLESLTSAVLSIAEHELYAYYAAHKMSLNTLPEAFREATEISIAGLTADLEIIEVECHRLWSTSELSSHARDVISSYEDFTSNGLAYVADLPKLGDSIRTILGLYHGVSVKSLASAWLSGRYGDRLTIADTKELFRAVAKALPGRSYQIARAKMVAEQRTYLSNYLLTHTRTSTVITRPGSHSDLMGLIDNLMRWDFWPTLENTWDLVPFSFVVDWFLNVSDILDHLDKTVQAPYLRVLSQYASDKLVMSVPYAVNSAYGDLTLTRYARGKYRVLDDIRPFDQVPSVPTFQAVNVLDLGALLVQLVK